MAGLQQRGDSYRLIFRHNGKQFSLPIGKVSREEAEAKSGQVDYMLLRIRQGLLSVPPGADIVEFLKHDGKPPDRPAAATGVIPTRDLTLGQLRDRYLASKEGAKEKTTLVTDRVQLKHFVTTFGEKFALRTLSPADLQRHVDRRKAVKTRKGTVKAATLKKEIEGLRAAWNWAVDLGHLAGVFPSKGLTYPVSDESKPFMTRAEIERSPSAERDWDALYLTAPEVESFLAGVRDHAAYPWTHPMVATAAYSGMRRSELIRAKVSDVDFDAKVITVQERKRVKGRRTTRRVPIPTTLRAILKGWLAVHPGGPYLFCHPDEVPRSRKRSRTTGHKNGKDRPTSLKGRMSTVSERERPGFLPLSPKEASDHLARALSGTEWSVVKGYHVLRHSFISACVMKGVDQRFIDEWVGHSTDEQRRRYRHLTPSSQDAAIESVFC